MNHDGQVFVFQMLVELVAQLRFQADQMHSHRQRAAGEDRPANLRLRSLV